MSLKHECLSPNKSNKTIHIKMKHRMFTKIKQVFVSKAPITMLGQIHHRHTNSCHSKYQGLLSPAIECNSYQKLVLRWTTGIGMETSWAHTNNCHSMCEGLLTRLYVCTSFQLWVQHYSNVFLDLYIQLPSRNSCLSRYEDLLFQ